MQNPQEAERGHLALRTSNLASIAPPYSTQWSATDPCCRHLWISWTAAMGPAPCCPAVSSRLPLVSWQASQWLTNSGTLKPSLRSHTGPSPISKDPPSHVSSQPSASLVLHICYSVCVSRSQSLKCVPSARSASGGVARKRDQVLPSRDFHSKRAGEEQTCKGATKRTENCVPG